jgi:S-adenosylmethionine decarboxylase
VGFEGVEKKLEIQFRKTLSTPDGLRAIPRERWVDILTLVNCKILSRASNDYFDCYVLSESSLFVYPFKVILKTCGTTSLLRCLERLLETAKEFVPDTEVEFAYFARRNFLYPHRQHPPHTSFDEEVPV